MRLSTSLNCGVLVALLSDFFVVLVFMSMRRYVFADEAGDFAFSRNPRASRYFIICTVILDSCEIGEKLHRLRRDLVWEGLPVRDHFHACEDKQPVRDRVFNLLAQEDFSIAATILEKSKAQPQTRTSNSRFYQYGWYYHFKGTHRRTLSGADEMLITAASVAQKKVQLTFSEAVSDVMNQFYGNRVKWITDHPPSSVDPCLQVADYCTWAIQRKWERNDSRSYDLISNKIIHEYDSWRAGAKHYY